MKICLIACLDTKGLECDFLKRHFEQGHHTIVILNTGIYPSQFKTDIETTQIVGAADKPAFEHLASAKNLSEAVKLICNNAPNTIPSLIDLNSIDVVIGMGGANGTLISTTIMKLFPATTRKICISTLAPAHVDLKKYAADKIEMIPAIVDLSGLNMITESILKYVINLVKTKTPFLEYQPASDISYHEQTIKFLIHFLQLLNVIPELQKLANQIIAITMFGNTTPCVEACHRQLSRLGYHVIIFHATGIGGEIMHYLIKNMCIKAGVLDVTTTELADLICSGSMSASRERFYAPSAHGVPHLIAPGCIDMVNYVPISSMPQQYAERKTHSWGADMLLMRTNVEENTNMGKFLAQVANKANGLVEFVLPTRGFSTLGQNDNLFFDNEADMALIQSIKNHADPTQLSIIDSSINDPEVSHLLVTKIHIMIQKLTPRSIAELPHLNATRRSTTREVDSRQHIANPCKPIP